MDTHLSHLEGEVKSATQNAKLNRIRQGITYLMLSLDPTDLLKAEWVIELIKNWSSVLVKEARQENRTTLED